MLGIIYYPVSFVLWCWHWVFGHLLGAGSGAGWVLSVVFLVFTLRLTLVKSFVTQTRSVTRMRKLAPELKKIKEEHDGDRRKQAVERQRLLRAKGINPLAGIVPILLQIPVLFGLGVVLRSFSPGQENYSFGVADVESYLNAHLFGAKLSNFLLQPAAELAAAQVSRLDQILVSVPLIIVVGVATHLAARRSIARQDPDSVLPQTKAVNAFAKYVFPVGAIFFGAFLPLGLLFYWLSNNVWTLAQQHLVFARVDREENARNCTEVRSGIINP